MKQSSDRHLIELVQNDNHLAFTVLVDRYWESLYKHIWLKIKDSDESKDIVQDIFLGFWKNRHTISSDGIESIAPYLFKAAKYAVINYFTRPGILVSDEKYGTLDFPSAINTDDQFLLKELKNVVDDEVSNLPERLQLPYRLSREQQLTIKEIAVRLSLSEQTVKNNISTALQKIRGRITEYNSDTAISIILAITVYLHHK